MCLRWDFNETFITASKCEVSNFHDIYGVNPRGWTVALIAVAAPVKMHWSDAISLV